MKKIVIVGMVNSIHLARWVNQITDQNWKIYIFHSAGFHVPHSDINNSVEFIHFNQLIKFSKKVKLNKLLNFFFHFLNLTKKIFKFSEVGNLVDSLNKISPNLIHSLEIQHAGYLVLAAKAQYEGIFPAWWVTNWGSDIFYFSRFKYHRNMINNVLANCNFYSCECERDIALLKKFKFNGKVFDAVPNAGGFETSDAKLYELSEPSTRKLILLKGYDNWSGRASVVLTSLSKMTKVIKNHKYEIVIFSAEDKIVKLASKFASASGISVRIIPWGTDHSKILQLHSEARISIGNSISDGISTSMLEAMISGSFPIQSDGACSKEWIVHGKNGFIIPAEDPIIIATLIRRALVDDNLVNKASEINSTIARKRLQYKLIKAKVIKMYETALND